MTSLLFLLLCVLSLCSAHQTFNPLTVVNPVDVVKDAVADSVASSFVWDEDMLRSMEDFSLQVLNTPNTEFVGDECKTGVFSFLKDLKDRKKYTFTMLDAWGKFESGVLRGNVRWPGRYYECRNVKAVNYAGRYCSVTLSLPPQIVSRFEDQGNNPLGILGIAGLSVGVCIPDTCNQTDLTSLISKVPLLKHYNLSVTASCPEEETEWDTKDILCLVIICIFSCLLFASTLYDYISEKRSSEGYVEFSNELNLHSYSVPSREIMHGKGHRVLTSFSIIQNAKRLFNTERRPTDITCLHGMRFLSISWVMLGHCFIFSVGNSDNIFDVAKYYVDHWELQAISNAYFSVDSFFFLSGLLVVYLGLRQLNRSGGRLNIPLMYLHRYIRLTPPYAFAILLSISLWSKFGSGPNWKAAFDGSQALCEKYWWSNLLYINNLYPADLHNECFAFGWYLANDMQFYLLSPFLLYLLYKRAPLGVFSISFLLTASIAITGGFSSHTQQQPMLVLFGYLCSVITQLLQPFTTGEAVNVDGFQGNGTQPAHNNFYMSDLYAKPWCRIGAYLVGMLTGYILYSNDNKVKMRKWAVFIGWTVASAVACTLVYALYPSFSTGHILNVNVAAFYNAVSRPVWCMTLAWVTVACVSGYGGPVNSFLSWKAFIPLSRLTYCSYLTHPLILTLLLGTRETTTHFTMYWLIMLFLATLILTHLMAFVLAMLIEFPASELMRILQDKGERVLPPLSTQYNGIGDQPLRNGEAPKA